MLLGLLAIAAGSIGVTWLLALRWTRYRRFYQLQDACRTHGLAVVPRERAALPGDSALGRLAPFRIRWFLTGGGITLLRAQSTLQTYNLLILQIPTDWPASALRPVRAATCCIDALELFSYPSTRGVERFTLHGVDPSAARRLDASQARGLLPPDIGLLIVGHELIIDFSERPFDAIEFDRMIALARQLAGILPVPRSAPAEQTA